MEMQTLSSTRSAIQTTGSKCIASWGVKLRIAVNYVVTEVVFMVIRLQTDVTPIGACGAIDRLKQVK